ncbi:MAG: GTP 3',8-cyclase MoaA, partial [Methanoregula sp.]|nr:GTP 3',8-cyclase MoaA [Methanoregula sp.]
MDETPMVLKDSFNRPITNIRISVVKQCNLSCIYCHREGEQSSSKQMTAYDIAEILRVSAGFGIHSVKFTG